VLEAVEDRSWLVKYGDALLDRGLPFRTYWHVSKFQTLAERAGCDLVFIPGGGYGGFTPFVTMSQNLLPFEFAELRRFGWSLMSLKFLLLRFVQLRAFKSADGVIFLSEYARNAVTGATGFLRGKTTIVPHGINSLFRRVGQSRSCAAHFSVDRPCRILYVSIVHVYKHHWHVAEAVSRLRAEGLPVTLELVGPPASGSATLERSLQALDPDGRFITYRGSVPYAELPEVYAAADIFVFASSCENMPNILVEAMASGLPIACSDRGPMPEVLGDAGLYFNPEDPDSIASAVRQFIQSPSLMAEKSGAAFNRSQQYSWERCARETFAFLAECARKGS